MSDAFDRALADGKVTETEIRETVERCRRTEEQMDRDTRRRRDLTHAGFDVYEFTYRQVTRTPQVLVSTARRILASDRADPRAAA